ncbi:hypothetical protein HXY33_04305 [Candidatus Bathyarchaeota archaeon]|nr:hypothetical protein [Candidatus Bathyarchaeota archaeon]
MAERKHKRETEGVAELECGDLGFVLEPTKIEVGAGYTLCVRYDENEKPIVDVKTYGEVDLTKLRTEIERVFPNAQIRQLKQTQSVTIVKKREKNSKTKKE